MYRKYAHKIDVDTKIAEKIIEALQNAQSLWVSAESIAEQINYDYKKVYNFLYYHDNILFIGKMNQRGELLFAWRDKYFREIPLFTKIQNAISNTIH